MDVTEPAPPLGDVTERVRHLEREALTRLTAAAGSESLCTLSRGGSPRPAAKYHEGAVAALARARRALDRSDAGEDAASAVRTVRDRWVAHAGADTTAAWRAYLDGGLDALDTLLDGPPEDTNTEPPARVQYAPALIPMPDTPTAITETSRATTIAPQGGGRWPRRRSIATVALAPILYAALVTGGGGWTRDAPIWAALVALVAVTGAAVLASYLPRPGHGWRPDLGCTPCAAVSALTILGAAWFLQAAPHQASMAAVALTAVGFGLLQRLTQAGTSCAT